MASDMRSSIRRFRVSRPSTESAVSAEDKQKRAPGVGRAGGPACDRCRSFKKKCSREFPVCKLCASAGQRCSFSSSASTQHLQARVEWLSQIINSSSTVGLTNIEAIETGAEVLPARSDGASPAIDTTSPAAATSRPRAALELNIGDDSPSPQNHRPTGALSLAALQNPRTPSQGDDSHVRPSSALPGDVTARRLVDAYFSNVNKAYPFIDRSKVLSDLETFGDPAMRKKDADSTILYLIMAIGYTTLRRAGQIAEDTIPKFDVAYSDIIQECLCRESVESLQILVLLALYSLFDPAGASPWSIVGVVSRQAILLGLTRKGSDDISPSAKDIELRHRLFWSIYVLDRMVAASLGLPMALTDEKMDVPLPGLTVEEFASPDRASYATILQTSRHVIRLRQLEDRILRQIHFRKHSEISALAHADRRAIIQDIQSDIEGWYSNGCLISPSEPDNLPIHSSITWLSARYYHLLLLLHYPCHLDLFGPVIPRRELLRFAQKHLQSTSVLFQQRQLPLNRITLCRLFPVALVLMHGFVWCAAKCVPFSARDEVAVLAAILDAFPEGWVHAHRGAAIVKQFIGVISSVAGYEPLHFSHNVFGQVKESYHTLVRPLIASLLDLMYQLLGRATSFAFQEALEDIEPAAASRLGEAMQYSENALYLGRSSLVGGPNLMPQAGTGSDDGMGLGWAGVELDFL